jgi:hypothetical protein
MYGDIRDLDLPGDFQFKKDSSKFVTNLRRHDFIKSSLQLADRILSKAKKLVREKSVYDASFTLDAIWKLQGKFFPRTLRLSGYFTNCTYTLSFIENEEFEIKIKPKVAEFVANQIGDDPYPIFLHMRLGDYLNHKTTFGVLSAKYFESCLQKIPNSRFVPVWVFTNDTEISKQILSNLDYKFRFIEEECPSDIKDPISILQMMSLGQTLICSNSTFSVMAALFSKPSSQIYYPEGDFFIDKSMNIINLPNAWIPVHTDWL